MTYRVNDDTGRSSLIPFIESIQQPSRYVTRESVQPFFNQKVIQYQENKSGLHCSSLSSLRLPESGIPSLANHDLGNEYYSGSGKTKGVIENKLLKMQQLHTNMDVDLFLNLRFQSSAGDSLSLNLSPSLVSPLSSVSDGSYPTQPSSPIASHFVPTLEALQTQACRQQMLQQLQQLKQVQQLRQLQGQHKLMQQNQGNSSLEAALSRKRKAPGAVPDAALTDRYKKWRMDDNLPLLMHMSKRGRKWESIKEAINTANSTKWTYGRVKHRCRHLLQEKRGQKRVSRKTQKTERKLQRQDSSTSSVGNDTEAFSQEHLNTALHLHKQFGDRYHRIHDFDPSTSKTAAKGALVSLESFSIAKIETEILRNCDCHLCQASGLKPLADAIKPENSNNDNNTDAGQESSVAYKAFIDEWTKVKAQNLHKLLMLHEKHKFDLAAIKAGMDWDDSWETEDVEFRVRHVCNSCASCAAARKNKSPACTMMASSLESSDSDN